jgi:hypothetical protein
VLLDHDVRLQTAVMKPLVDCLQLPEGQMAAAIKISTVVGPEVPPIHHSFAGTLLFCWQ